MVRTRLYIVSVRVYSGVSWISNLLLPIEVSYIYRRLTKRDDRNLSTPAASDSLVHFLFLISFSSGRALVAYHADVYSLAYTFAPFLLFVFDAGSHKAIIRWKGKHKCCFFLFKIMIIQDPFLGWVYFLFTRLFLIHQRVVIIWCCCSWYLVIHSYTYSLLLSYSAVVVVETHRAQNFCWQCGYRTSNRYQATSI